MKTTYLLSLPLFLFTSCATITRGVHEKLTVLSEPSGANVVLSSGETGVTPTKFVKTRRDNFTVTVSKPGFIGQSVRVESKASATGETAMAGNILVGGLIGAGVDATSGAYNSLYPNPVSVRLVPVRKSAPAADTERP
jgi:PEGA domain